MSTDRNLSTEEFYVVRDLGWSEAEQVHKDDPRAFFDNPDGAKDQAAGVAHGRACDDEAYSEIGAAELSDAVWEGVEAFYSDGIDWDDEMLVDLDDLDD